MTSESWDLKGLSQETHELVKKAAKHNKQGINEWVEEVLQRAAHEALEPEVVINDPAKMGALLKSIDKRLAKMEQSPLQHGARMVSEGAKVFSEGARDIYEKVEARKWFDKSYETATKACDTLSVQFKTWWESRGGKTSAEESEGENVVEGEVIKDEAAKASKEKK